ncbi:MAG: hypothetical protein DRH90_01345 [Deltaproteobacteria bacterium]|nr:MAG: hypothetical protein DRH90_01345 [Deltaproteobacteria bacterium]RLC18081.1 MAG: hypothetical protein DRI24_04030 [Deltaproteobacteria bacterium]
MIIAFDEQIGTIHSYLRATMSFKENLLKKIRIKFLGQNILTSMGSVDSGKRTDINAVRELLGMSPYTHHKERDLDLYIQKTDGEKHRIIVLGNDLPMYLTTVADVTMRRSPTVKEMISIRNAFKILNDKDVIVKKGPETLEALQKECIDLLDLSYKKADLIAMAEDGTASLENAYQDGVIESLSLFGELLGFQHAPKELLAGHFYVMGLSTKKSKQGTFFGPMVLYGKMHNELKFIDESMSVLDKGKIEWIRQVAKGMAPAPVEGPDVFQALLQAVIKS